MSVWSQPPTPAISTATPADVYALVLEYRARLAEWVGQNTREMALIVDNFNSLMSSSKYRNSTLTSQDSAEIGIIADTVDMANKLHDKTLPLVETLATSAASLLAATPTVSNLQALVDAVTAAIINEIDEGSDESVTVFKTLIKSIVDTALLNTTYDITASELSEIATAKASFISDKKSEADEKMFLIERASVNSLIANGQLHSTRGADTLTRMTAKNTRIYLEIEKQADQYEIDIKREAFTRIYQKMELKIRSGGIIPQDLIKLPNPVWAIFDGILNRLFLSPGEFVNQLPQLLTASIASLSDVSKLLQDERFKKLAGNQSSDQNITALFNTVLAGYGTLISSTGKLATFEGV